MNIFSKNSFKKVKLISVERFPIDELSDNCIEILGKKIYHMPYLKLTNTARSTSCIYYKTNKIMEKYYNYYINNI